RDFVRESLSVACAGMLHEQALGAPWSEALDEPEDATGHRRSCVPEVGAPSALTASKVGVGAARIISTGHAELRTSTTTRSAAASVVASTGTAGCSAPPMTSDCTNGSAKRTAAPSSCSSSITLTARELRTSLTPALNAAPRHKTVEPLSEIPRRVVKLWIRC